MGLFNYSNCFIFHSSCTYLAMSARLLHGTGRKCKVLTILEKMLSKLCVFQQSPLYKLTHYIIVSGASSEQTWITEFMLTGNLLNTPGHQGSCRMAVKLDVKVPPSTREFSGFVKWLRALALMLRQLMYFNMCIVLLPFRRCWWNCLKQCMNMLYYYFYYYLAQSLPGTRTKRRAHDLQ